jgi:hypothetical protein
MAAKHPKSRRRRPPRNPQAQVASITVARAKKRAQDVADMRTHISHLADRMSDQMDGALPPDTLRCVAGGMMTFFAAALGPNPKTTMRSEDGRDIPMDGQQMRDLGHQLLWDGGLSALVRGLLTPVKTAPALSLVCATCGHTKKQHTRAIITWSCQGDGKTPSLIGPSRCECTAFVATAEPTKTA